MTNSASKASKAKTITRCPQCKTAFRVTADQLNAAKGMVRCGSCLTIFKAYDYIATPIPNKDKKVYNDENVISGGLNLNDNSFTESSTQTSHSLFERQPQKEKRHNDAADESWAVDLLAELEDDDDIKPIIVKRKQSQQKAASSAKSKAETDTANTISATKASTPKPESSAATDPSSDDVDNQPNKEPAPDSTPLTRPATETDSKLNQEPSTKSAINNQSSELPAGMEIDWQQNRSSGIRWSWVIASLIGIVLIIVQVALFQFDTLSRQAPYRNWYSAACSALDCELPHLVDIKKIKRERLEISSHPTKDNAITVDVILNNTASFDQPYPEVILTFTNLKDNVVAQRTFTPSEYLAGDLKGHTIMPKQQRVQFDLELVRPGPDATGYELSIR